MLDETLLQFKNAYGRFHPMMELPEEIDIEFAPIRQGLQLLRELHRQRNYRPIADTIHALLETTRAHAASPSARAASAFWPMCTASPTWRAASKSGAPPPHSAPS